MSSRLKDRWPDSLPRPWEWSDQRFKAVLAGGLFPLSVVSVMGAILGGIALGGQAAGGDPSAWLGSYENLMWAGLVSISLPIGVSSMLMAAGPMRNQQGALNLQNWLVVYWFLFLGLLGWVFSGWGFLNYQLYQKPALVAFSMVGPLLWGLLVVPGASRLWPASLHSLYRNFWDDIPDMVGPIIKRQICQEGNPYIRELLDQSKYDLLKNGLEKMEHSQLSNIDDQLLQEMLRAPDSELRKQALRITAYRQTKAT